MSPALEALRKTLGDCVDTTAERLDAHRHDYWMLAEIEDRTGDPAPRPLAVVTPRTTAETADAVRICREQGLPLVPFGGASGVCGAIRSDPGCIVLSTRGLDGLVSLDDRDLVARFRGGTLGGDAERAVQAHGLTIGHWPQSIELSTVGGWVATRAAGQYSTAYGSIEDLLLDLEVVLPDASVLRTRETPRAAAGPDLRHLFLGSEGTLGIVTEVGLSLRARAEASQGQTFSVPDLASGLEASRKILRAGWQPPVLRLCDAAEAGRQHREHCPEGHCFLLLLHEGPQALVDVQVEAVRGIVSGCGGREADAAPVDHWLEHRNEVPSWGDLLERGLVVDTIEVATTWSRVEALYQAVTGAIREVPDVLVASAHTSHGYRSGTNLYFTFAARPADPSAWAATYRACWDAAMRATIACGAGIAHHHGIGRVRRDHLEAEIGAPGVSLLRRLKRTLDPGGLFNPGALLPPA